MRQQLQMLRRRQFVIPRNQHAAAEKNRVCRNQPLRLIGHDDRRAVPHLEIGVLKRAAKRTRHFLKVRVGKPHFFAVAIGFNQAGFVGPALQRILERCTQAGILAEIKHSMFLSHHQEVVNGRWPVVSYCVSPGSYDRQLASRPPLLQTRLDPIRQRTKIRHALQFVVRQLDREVMLQPGQQVERLQAVDPERLEEVIVGRKLLPRHLKVGRRKIENLVERVIGRRHEYCAFQIIKLQITNYKFTASTVALPHSLQTCAALLRPLDANKGRKKYQSPASTPHTGSVSQTPSPPLPSAGQISRLGWPSRALPATPRLRRQSGSPARSAAPSLH